MFEFVYFANPISKINNRLVYDLRFRLGDELAEQIKHRLNGKNNQIAWESLDSIIPVPDTSRTAALSIAESLNIPFREGILKNRYLPRTFIINDEGDRSKTIAWKYSFVEQYITGKNILIVDDSIVRGSTITALIKKILAFNPASIHICITCPPIMYPCYYGIDFSTKGELIAARLSAIAAVSIAGYFGINPPDFVAATVALAFGLAAASFFPAIILGIFYKRMNKEGAVAGMVTGMLFMLYYMLKFKFDKFGGGSQEDWWFGISPEGFGTIAMFINFIVSLIVSSFTPKPPKEIQDLVENIRIPSGVEKAKSH
jgi:adenine/guanine phosphoribosyltransferase-like PRPP-binding protein